MLKKTAFHKISGKPSYVSLDRDKSQRPYTVMRNARILPKTPYRY